MGSHSPLTPVPSASLDVFGVLACRGRAPCPHQQKDDRKDSGCARKLHLCRVALAILGDLQLRVLGQGMKLLRAELVVHQASESDGVAEELLASNRVAEQDHRCKDQQHILQDAGHSKDDGRGFADLQGLGQSQALLKLGRILTRRTPDTFSRKATKALARRIMGPRL